MAKKEIETVLGLGEDTSGQSDPELTIGSGLIRGNEVLDPGSVEIRFGDIEKDAEALANLFSHPDVIGHLSGIAPPQANRGEIRRSLRRYHNFGILVATTEDIKDYYRRTEDKLIVVQKPNGKVIGSVTVEGSGLGVFSVTLGRLVVDPNEQGQHIGKDLTIQACAYILASQRDGGLDKGSVRASVIQGVKGSEKPVNMFIQEGFKLIGQTSNSCASWDSENGKFESRNTAWMFLERDVFNRRYRDRDTNQDFFRKKS